MTETLRYIQKWPDKFPGEVELYGVDWTDRLAGAAIASVSATVETGDVVITSPAVSFSTGDTQYVWVSAGTIGRQVVTTQAITNESPPRTLEEVFAFDILEAR
jgi:hypothetical protein